MGHVIPFPLPQTLYPDLMIDLGRAECVLLTAIRWWVESYRAGEDPIPRLTTGLEAAGAPAAAFSIDGLMTVMARAVSRPIEIHCPGCPHLCLDEKHLLRAASLAQAEESRLAEKVLRTTLLSAPGAEFAMGPLEGLGELFAQARLLLSQRWSTAEDRATGDGREAWFPTHPVQ